MKPEQKHVINRSEDEGINGYRMLYGDTAIDYVAYVRLTQKRVDNQPVDVWTVEVIVTFNTPELMPATVTAESERAATETTAAPAATSETSNPNMTLPSLDDDLDDDDDFDSDNDEEDDDDDWDDDDDFWDF